MSDTDLSKSYMVKKSNHLIEAQYKLSLGEQKLILVMASMINANDKDFCIYRIKIKEFMDFLGVKSNNSYAEIKDITENLMKKVLVIKKPRSTIQVAWLASAEYFDGKGYVELQFSPKLKPYLLSLKERFTRYQVKNIIQLKSNYSIRIYELLKQYEKIGQRTIELDELKNILGIKTGEYKLYGHFKSKILKVAQKELADKTDLSFEYEEIKHGRKVGEIRFLIHSQPRHDSSTEVKEVTFVPPLIETSVLPPLQGAEEHPLYHDALFALIENGLEEKEALRLLETRDPQEVLVNAMLAREKFEAGKANDLAGFTVDAVENDLRFEQIAEDDDSIVAVQPKQRNFVEEQENKALLQGLYKSYQQTQKDKLDTALSELSESEQIALWETFVARMNKAEKDLYRKHGKDSAIVQGSFRGFIKPRLLPPYMLDFVLWAFRQGHEVSKVDNGEAVESYRLVR